MRKTRAVGNEKQVRPGELMQPRLNRGSRIAKMSPAPASETTVNQVVKLTSEYISKTSPDNGGG